MRRPQKDPPPVKAVTITLAMARMLWAIDRAPQAAYPGHEMLSLHAATLARLMAAGYAGVHPKASDEMLPRVGLTPKGQKALSLVFVPSKDGA